ncbi:MAG: methylenetetrahydrofolate reductase C-terminal domain-containing protein [Chloroflexota bacterium]
MKTISAQKPIEEILQFLEKSQKVFIVGCGTCATMCRTGGKAEVMGMKEKLEAAGKEVTGWVSVPTSCDELTRYALDENEEGVAAADAVLALVCAFGVQMLALHTEKLVFPGLDTMFLGIEDSPGHFQEVCMQCGRCVLGHTAAICPIVRCAKSLLNGPCGGSSDGKCEISRDIPCAWQLIHDRLKAIGRLDILDEIEPVKDWSASSSGGPRQAEVESECGVVTAKAETAVK